MPNNLSKNTTLEVARIFLEKFENRRLLSKAVDTQLLTGRFNPRSGSRVDFKRPHDFFADETADGNISGRTKNALIAGVASGRVQNYITVATEWLNVEQALELDQLDDILDAAATRVVTQLELNLGRFMIQQLALTYGQPGTPVTQWGHIAGAHSLMDSLGVPADYLCYMMNPFTTQNLADTQSGLASGSNNLVDTAWKRAQISKDFGGMKVMSSNALETFQAGTATDRAGAVANTPDGTYTTHKDTMIQAIDVSGFSGTQTIAAGETVEITGRHYLSQSTRRVILGADGLPVVWRGTVTQDVTLVAGAGTLLVAGPAIVEANGQYNTADSAVTAGDIVTILGTANQTYQPNLFFHKQAIGLGSVEIPKLDGSVDTTAETEDGMSIRVSRYSDGDANTQKIRFDLLPAFCCFNPFFGGKGYGLP